MPSASFDEDHDRVDDPPANIKLGEKLALHTGGGGGGVGVGVGVGGGVPAPMIIKTLPEI